MTGFPISKKRGIHKLKKTPMRKKKPKTGSNSRVSIKALIIMLKIMSQYIQNLKLLVKMICWICLEV